jgi:hypothetical protein
LSLPIRLPTYDMRNPIKGHADFSPAIKGSCPSTLSDEGKLWFVLSKTEPEYYLDHFLSLWKGMRASKGGQLDDQKLWQLEVQKHTVTVRLKDPCIEFTELEGVETAWLCCGWRHLAAGFFKRC